MNNNYDPNQHPQYGVPQQQEYQQQEYQQAPQYQQPVYQQPLYAQPALNPTPFFVMSIIGLALSASAYFAVVGIILSAIAMGKAKNYFANGGPCEGKAKVAKILSTIGLWVGVGMTVILLISFAIGVALGLAGAGSSYSDMPAYFY